ncbi:tetratricopeptide repeat protein [Gardnerella greenwoodii]|uniref:tetratricopeptide repeat protein n=1 Tax=Gardnerella greenwoodii TaxID=2914925 RepID=UPI0002DAD26B|nr:hypothetical protein [Gardnerella greenwoodii]
MGEERGSRSGKSFGNRGNFGHRNGGKSGERRGGFHKDGFHKSGSKRSGFRSENRDGEHRFNRNRRFDDRRDDRRSRDFEHSGEEGGNPRYKKFDGEKRFDRRNNHNENRRENNRGGNFHKDFHKDSRSDFGDNRRDNRSENRRFDNHHNNRYDRNDRNDRNDRYDRNDRNDRNDRYDRNNRNENRRFDEHRSSERRNGNAHGNVRFENGPRRNSDGTVSYPSQNPYTARRPGEPKMPKGLEWAMLSKEDRERLRGLSKEHAENIGLHILAAYVLQEENPDLALEHAKCVAKQASRIDFARETLAFVSYRQGDYKLAAKEFRTAMRMNGYLDYLPFIADCERGMGNLDKALEICMSDEAKSLKGEVKAEMFLVYAGVLFDTDHADKAIELVHAMGRSKGLPGEYRMRAVQAEQYFLEEAGRSDEAVELESLLDSLENQYADADDDDINTDDIVIDYDLEHLNDAMMDEIGVSEDDCEFAPEEDESED